MKRNSRAKDRIAQRYDAKQATRWYGVLVGRRTGVFGSWIETQKAVSGYRGAVYKAFLSYEDASAFAGAVKKRNIASDERRGSGRSNDKIGGDYRDGDDSLSRRLPHARICRPQPLSESGGRRCYRMVVVYVNVIPVKRHGRASFEGFAYGVCLSPRDTRNRSGLVPPSFESNERRAGLFALLEALRALATQERASTNACLLDESKVQVHCDCSIAVMWARDHLAERWMHNGWHTARGTPPVDMDILDPLAQMMRRAPGGVTFVHRLHRDSGCGIECARRLALQASLSDQRV